MELLDTTQDIWNHWHHYFVFCWNLKKKKKKENIIFPDLITATFILYVCDWKF